MIIYRTIPFSLDPYLISLDLAF